MKKEIELLAPVGDFECLKAAVQNGANSVYFGASLFNARASATNFDDDELEKVINYCALRNVKTHLTLNILIKDKEFKDAVILAKKAYELGINALIIQDVGLAKFLMKLFPDLPIHASTQMTIHNLEGVQELEKLGYSRAVLSRELSIQEIEYICNNSNIEIETFIHGALCISYSGQCFFSSMIGGRSGNRGKCAQPCRLPYELVEENFLKNNNSLSKKNQNTETIIDNGYLISPRDLCSLEYLPDLINAGVKCFKIEGRLKSPEYVAVVTRIYRKYIDMVLNNEKYIIDENDVLALKQIFNRGGFSSGHLSTHPNHNLIFKEKPNNMGLYLGNVAGYNKLKGHIKLLLNEPISIGDTVSFEKENTKYTVSELMINNSNISNANVGAKVVIGRMKGNIHIGDKIYKLSSKKQLNEANDSYSRENIKLPLKCNLHIKEGEPISITVSLHHLKEPLYKNISTKIQSSIIPEVAINNPITEERILSQLKKTNNTPFEFTEINIDMDNNLFIPSIKDLNELRRMALSKIENMIISKNKRETDLNEKKLDAIFEKHISNFTSKNMSSDNQRSTKNIAVYFNIINPELDYSKLSKKHISCVYIPLRYFMRKNCIEALKTITSNFKTYIYMPAIIKANYKNIIKHSLEDLINQYNIYGFIISSLGDLVLLEKYKKDFDFIGNFTLNTFNTFSINTFKNLGISKITLSPELNLDDINNIRTILNRQMPLELIVYGNMPIMKMNYCLLGCSNKCYPQCKMRCNFKDNKYYLKDRLGFKFRILPDNIQTVTTIFNSKTTAINHTDTQINSIRIDLLDENIEETNFIIESCYNGKKLEGKNYTYGNLNREV